MIAFILRQNCVTLRDPEGIWLNSDPVSSREEGGLIVCKCCVRTHLVNCSVQGLLHIFHIFCRVSGGCNGAKLYFSQCLTPSTAEKSVYKQSAYLHFKFDC